MKIDDVIAKDLRGNQLERETKYLKGENIYG